MIKKLLLTPMFLGFAIVGLHAEENVAGKTAYAICAACHGADGKGVAVGDKKMAASLAGSKVVNGDASVLALAIMKGIKQEGTEYMVPMAPLEAVFSDDAKFAALLTYVPA